MQAFLRSGRVDAKMKPVRDGSEFQILRARSLALLEKARGFGMTHSNIIGQQEVQPLV